jgi:hypothetical protein
MAIASLFETRFKALRAVIVSRCMLSLVKHVKLHETGGSCGSRASWPKTPRRLGTINLQLVAGLGGLAGGVSVSGRCHTFSLHTVHLRVTRYMRMMLQSYISVALVLCDPHAAVMILESPGNISPEQPTAAQQDLYLPVVAWKNSEKLQHSKARSTDNA